MIGGDLHAPLFVALQRLDRRIHREIRRLRAVDQLSQDELRGLYVSDEQVDRLVRQREAGDGYAGDEDDLPSPAAAMMEGDGDAELASRWRALSAAFELTPFEQEVVLLALAPEVDLKYATLYAYLANDVTRRSPTRDVALRLFSDEPAPHPAHRGRLDAGGPLFRHGLLELLRREADRPLWLAAGFTIAPVVSSYLLGQPAREVPLPDGVRCVAPSRRWRDLSIPGELRAALSRVPRLPAGDAPLVILEGREGSGRAAAAEALAFQLGVPLVRVDLRAAQGGAEPLRAMLRSALLHQRLWRSVIHLRAIEGAWDADGRVRGDARSALAALAEASGPVVVAAAPGTAWRDLFEGARTLRFTFEDPGAAERLSLWRRQMTGAGDVADLADLQMLADGFILTPGQIRRAARATADRRALAGGIAPHAGESELLEAARDETRQVIGQLARKVPLTAGWDDLVLPDAIFRQVREIAASVRLRSLVYTEWGFERRLAGARGLRVLFSGASGTGKTMTAAVIARELGLDLYTIDLSSICSKYIGETEKNLDRVFRAAHCSNAILFFDEADALFGRRSEVKDAHDRYANIEVAYLLQKMEEHDGVVVLATNLSRNIDHAFSRRMHHVVEFPVPAEAHRERLWRGMFPPQVPLADDVDFAFLAKQFPLAGGDVRNVALDAAFLAAQNGRVVTMHHLVRAMARQMVKVGRTPSPTDFKHHHALITQGE